MSAILLAARAAYAAGLAPLPVSNSGSKAPDVPRWKVYQTTRPSVNDMRAFDFARHDGLGIIAGAASGYRECWDFDTDDGFLAYIDRAHASGLGALADRLIHGYLDRTPGGGRRIIVAYPASLEFKDVTLARRPGRPGEPAIKTLIELPTFAIVAPSSGRTHPSGKAYERVHGDFHTIASYTADERAALVSLARTFDEMARPEAHARSPKSDGHRPGDDYDRRTSWAALLESHGWREVYQRDAVTYWRRPGKTVGVSATTNFGGRDLLYVFTTSTEFDPGRSYSKFAALAVLEHQGDFAQAALALLRQGYGDNPSADPLDDPSQGATPPTPRPASAVRTPPTRSLRLTPASEITVRPVTWLWKERLPVGVFALIGGREGVGKSILAYTLAAEVTTGKLPGIHAGTPKGVIVCATEDSWAHTIAPRLMAAGADLTRVYRADVIDPDGFEVPLSLPRDTAELSQAITDVDCAMVILDPLLSRLDARLDSHKDADTRRMLEPLSGLADSAKVTIVGLIHCNKSASTDALTLLMASRAFTAVARLVLFVGVDPDEDRQRQVFVAKNNYGRLDVPTLLFEVGDALVATTADGEDIWTGKLTWTGKSDRTLRDVLEQVGEKERDAEARGAAEVWLLDYLKSQGGTAASKMVIAVARQAGHTLRTLTRARRHAEIETDNRGFPRETYWRLPSISQATSVATPNSSNGPPGDGGPRRTDEVQSGQHVPVGPRSQDVIGGGLTGRTPSEPVRPPGDLSPARGPTGDDGPTRTDEVQSGQHVPVGPRSQDVIGGGLTGRAPAEPVRPHDDSSPARGPTGDDGRTAQPLSESEGRWLQADEPFETGWK